MQLKVPPYTRTRIRFLHSQKDIEDFEQRSYEFNKTSSSSKLSYTELSTKISVVSSKLKDIQDKLHTSQLREELNAIYEHFDNLHKQSSKFYMPQFDDYKDSVLQSIQDNATVK